MKRSGNWILCAVCIVLLASCFDPPQYSNVPAIVLDNVIFKTDSDPSTPDSLIVSVKFTDGDGDLGLDANNPTDTLPPYNNKNYFRFSDGTYITYKTKRTKPGYDTLPAYIKPYNCINWDRLSVNSKIDTFYFQLNPNHYNFDVDFLIFNQAANDYIEFDPQKEFAGQCGESFNGRFPVLSQNLSKKAALEGTIRYAMQSVAFQVLFSGKSMKLRITIRDRALNKSNTIVTDAFTLASITQKG